MILISMGVYKIYYKYWRMSNNVEKTYKKVTQIQHILMRPDMYVGSVTANDEQLWVLQDDHFQFAKIKYIPALYKIFDEILVNAADNYQRDKKMSVIRVSFTKDQISVFNDGKSIPVQMHKTHKMLVPELIFGHLLTSSNYDDNQKKTTGGRNGFGAKLTNIFSSKFSIQIADSVNKKLLKIVWENNMTQMAQPIVEDYDGSSYTKVTFTPDYKRFGIAKLSPDMLNLLKRRVYDMSGLIKVSVYLNNKLIQIPNFKSYVNMYLDEETEILAQIGQNRQSRWHILVCRSQGQFMQVSFVNGIYTSKGGTHVNYILDQIIEKILQITAKKKQPAIKPFQIKAQLKIFVNCLIDNPSFDSQNKENLTTHYTQFGSTCDVSDDFVKEILKSGIIEKIQQQQRAKQHSKIGKELRKLKKNRLIIPKLDDANEAGRSDQCCLILTQGDSAKALALCGIEQLGRDYYGVYPLKGKLVNVKQLTPKQVMQNLQLSNLVKILGLSFQQEYSSTKDLRYSSVMLMADQDNDGSHIKGLVINFFETFWPSLCRIKGFLKEFITPIVKCKKGNNSINFYSQVDYRKWEESGEDGWTIKYYKGLGTSTAKQAKQYFTTLDKHELTFEYKDGNDKQSLDLAFGKKNADLRKNWLSNYNPDISLDHSIKEVKVSDFIHKELIHFSISDNVRSIPSVIDGLKPSQRKVLFSCFKRNLVNEIKVAQLAGYVAQHSAYHHGQMSLCSTIIGMAQNYVGSNNLNLLEPIGQFGTRYQNGKDAASARYIFTKQNKLTRSLFNEADDHVVDYIIEQNQMIEPRYYIPILPLVLINGSEGIGTGWSTTVYPHKIEDVIEMVRKRIAGQFKEICIGWQQFKGSIEKDKKSYIVKGVFERDGEKIIIREIPPVKSIRDYKQFLQQKLSSIQNQNPEIQDLKQYHQNNNIEFVIKFIDECEPIPEELEKYLKISSTYQQNNMHLFTNEGKIKKYENVLQILEEFYQLRLAAYQKRKRYLLSKYQKQDNILKNQMRFIEMMMNGEFKMIEKKQDWITRLRQYNFNTYQEISKIISTKIREDDEQYRNKDFNYLLTMPIWSFCREKVQNLASTREELSTIIHYYQHVTLQELWLKDIDQFEEAWRQTSNQFEGVVSSQKLITSKKSLKRSRQDLQMPEEIKPIKTKRNSKQNLMQEQLNMIENKGGRKIVKTESIQIKSQSQIKPVVNEKVENKASNIDGLLSKYLGSNEKKEQMSLEMRVRARISNGDEAFKASYQAAKVEMAQQQNNSKISDDEDYYLP